MSRVLTWWDLRCISKFVFPGSIFLVVCTLIMAWHDMQFTKYCQFIEHHVAAHDLCKQGRSYVHSMGFCAYCTFGIL